MNKSRDAGFLGFRATPRTLLRQRRPLPRGAHHPLSAPRHPDDHRRRYSVAVELDVRLDRRRPGAGLRLERVEGVRRSVKRWVTSERQVDAAVWARKRSVSGHTPGEPIEPVIVQLLGLDEPELGGRLAADVDADVGDAALERRDLEGLRHHRRAPGGLDHDVGAARRRSGRRAASSSSSGCDGVVRRPARAPPRGGPARARRRSCAHPWRPDAAHDGETDRARRRAPRRVAGVDAAGPHQRVVRDAERLDERAHWSSESSSGSRCSHAGLGDEELGGGAADREAEVVVADHALPHDAVARREPRDLLADRARPRPTTRGRG